MPRATAALQDAVKFITAAIKAIAASNTAVDQDRGKLAEGESYQWVHCSYTPLAVTGEPRRQSLKALFVSAVGEGMIKVDAKLKEEANALNAEWSEGVRLFVAACKRGENKGVFVQKGVSGGYAIAVTATLPNRTERDAKATRHKATPQSRKQSILAQI